MNVANVTFNSTRYIRQCLQFVQAQDYPALELIVIDNASSDGTAQLLREFEDRAQVVYNVSNNGFAGGQNQAIALARGAWVLALNPDVRLTPDFIGKLVAAGERDGAVGTVCGKLLAMSADFAVPAAPVLDSTGIYFTPNLRHFDRGSQQEDEGQYARAEYVFGATGAAALYRKRMIEDISLPGGFFDAAFFAYREDADVAWRAQLLGWRCLYTPDAIAYHVRTVLPSNRNAVAPVLNLHSVKNRFLMRINNMTLPLYLRYFASITARDLLVLAACLLRERTSLRAFWLVCQGWRTSWQNRRFIMSRRKVTDQYLAQWFAAAPLIAAGKTKGRLG